MSGGPLCCCGRVPATITPLVTEDGMVHERTHCRPQFLAGAASSGREKRPERSDREGDSQPMPSAGTGPAIHELVQADLQRRLELGTRRYGQPLRAYNGRSALQDAYEEALDLACYLRQRLEEERLREDDGR